MDHFRHDNCIGQLSIDCVIFGYQQRQLKVLAPKLIFSGDFWALPGGFILQDEDIDQAAARILYDRTGIKDIYLEQFRVFGKAGRNNRESINRLRQMNPNGFNGMTMDEVAYEWLSRRFVSIGYYALVDINKVIPQKSEIDASIDWYPVRELPDLIMDHKQMVEEALQTLRRDLDEKLCAFNLLPHTFTMKELQGVYESIFDRSFVRPNFQKKMLDLNILERLGKKYTGAANKAPYLYAFKSQEHRQLS